MTTERNVDRIVAAWLDLMPSEAPDRAVTSVLEAVATEPQARVLARAFRRSPLMTRLLIAATVAVLAIAGIGGAILISGGRPSTAPPAPTVSATPSGANAPVSTRLQSRWFGGHRDFLQPDKGSTVVFTAESFVMTQSDQWDSTHFLDSKATETGDGQLRLELAANGNGCEAGDVGIYSWTLSSTGRTLTITPEADECATRLGSVPGTWWLAGCPNELCLGELDAGTYQTQYIAPRLDPGVAWQAHVGGLTYSVPEGWANSNDGPDSFELVPASEMPLVSETDRRRNIGVFRQPTAMTQDRPCSDEVEPGVGRTVDDLTVWLGTVNGLVSTEPTPISIDGRPGQSLDLRLDPSWTATCEGGTERLLTYLNPGLAVGEDQRERLILLDLGDGDVVAVAIWARDQATFDAFAPEAMSVIDSFRFE